MSTTAIDLLTDQFYKTVSFKNGIMPDINTLHTLFYGTGSIINNSLEVPEYFTAQSFVQFMEAQVAAQEIRQFLQYEIYANTEIFGNVARRLSVYEYSFADHELERMPRGISFIQFIKIDSQWKITSMVWNDENENYQLPTQYLIGKQSLETRDDNEY